MNQAVSTQPATGEINTASAQLDARRARVFDAFQLRKPDRVPLFLPFLNILSQLEGTTNLELYNDAEKHIKAVERAALRFEPDLYEGMFLTPEISRALGDRMTKWPGYGLEPAGSYQYHESDYMKPEDYDAFIADPGDWAMRRYLPRVFGELEGLGMLPPLGMFALGTFCMMQSAAVFAMPPVLKALEALTNAGRAQLKWLQETMALIKHMEAIGFPPSPLFAGPNVVAPFDFMADTLRGMRGVFSDMRRCPEKLLAAEEKVIPIMLEHAFIATKVRHLPFAFIPLHRGSDGFISVPNFEKFYWPQLKRTILALIDAGVTPFILWEGCWDQRLEYLAELPKGKIIGGFQDTNLIKAKEVIGDVMCIIGGMPNGMLTGDNATLIREHTHKMCETVGKGGGFIMSTAVGDLEGANPEMIEVWAEATRKYGAL